MKPEQLANELIRRAQEDQAMRTRAIKDMAAWDEGVDKKNTAFLKKVVKSQGWPRISDVGVEASQAAWLLLQHADLDLDFQKQCLALMKALPEDEVSLRNIAYVEDRVLVAEGKAQLYGTQFYRVESDFGPSPIADTKNLDKRRKSMGLEPFAEYEKVMIERYKSQT